MTAAPITQAAGGGASASPPGASRFFARNAEVFMVSEQGGFCLSAAECARCLAHWRATADREPWAQRMTEQMADELEAAMAEAVAQADRRIAA